MIVTENTTVRELWQNDFEITTTVHGIDWKLLKSKCPKCGSYLMMNKVTFTQYCTYHKCDYRVVKG